MSTYGGYQNSSIGFDSQLALPSTAWNTNSTNANFNNKWANKQNNQTAIKQDWSAFESLLPNQNNNTNEVKKLSDNEMMDLLS